MRPAVPVGVPYAFHDGRSITEGEVVFTLDDWVLCRRVLLFVLLLHQFAVAVGVQTRLSYLQGLSWYVLDLSFNTF